ncbi:MAG: dephospho-CoA kinase, partial [Actinomycetota bacterium]
SSSAAKAAPSSPAVLIVGLTGGIGSGKTTVSKMLAERGAVVFDADKLAREAVELGTRGYVAVVELFGFDVLQAGGEIDRPALAARVFSNDLERRELESVLHPEIFRMFEERVAPFRETDRVVVFDVPLLVETGYDTKVDVVMVVEAKTDTRVERVMADKGRTEADIRARNAVQASEEAKEARADVVIRNDGSLEGLERTVERIWGELQTRAARSG